MGAHVQRGQHLACGIAHRHGHRAQAHFQFLVDDHPALASDFRDAGAQPLGGVHGAAGLHLQVGVFEVVVQRGVIQRGEEDAAHGGAVGRQAAANAEVHGDQPVGRGRTGDVEDLVPFQGGHGAGFVELVAEAVEDRLGGNRQRGRGQVSMAQGQHLGQQRIGAPVGGDVAQLHQRVQAATHGGAGNLGAVADLGDGQVAFALLERMDHRQPPGQGSHEVGVAGKGFDALGRRSDDRWGKGRQRGT
ncbi:hypothetical protein D9M72_324780 [compost metagenome]